MPKFWAISGYVGEINDKKFSFQLALPKDRQSFCEVKKKRHQISKKNKLLHMNYPNVLKMQKFSKKIPIGSGYNSRLKYVFSTKHAQKFHLPVFPQRMKKMSMSIGFF